MSEPTGLYGGSRPRAYVKSQEPFAQPAEFNFEVYPESVATRRAWLAGHTTHQATRRREELVNKGSRLHPPVVGDPSEEKAMQSPGVGRQSLTPIKPVNGCTIMNRIVDPGDSEDG